jgi:hypothetical protein
MVDIISNQLQQGCELRSSAGVDRKVRNNPLIRPLTLRVNEERGDSLWSTTTIIMLPPPTEFRKEEQCSYLVSYTPTIVLCFPGFIFTITQLFFLKEKYC